MAHRPQFSVYSTCRFGITHVAEFSFLLLLVSSADTKGCNAVGGLGGQWGDPATVVGHAGTDMALGVFREGGTDSPRIRQSSTTRGRN